LNLGGNFIVESKGYDPDRKKEVDEKARILIKFHEEIPNNRNATKSIFTNLTS
jgi:hypothetical protein